MKQPRHIFLTGATGFIWSHIIKRLLSKWNKISILLRKESNTKRVKEYIKNGSVQIVFEDKIEYFFKNNTPDAVIHLATVYKKQHKKSDIHDMIIGNIEWPTHLAQLCVNHWVKYFINTGTFFEYELNSSTIITEQTKEKAYNLYASTKLALNETLQFFSEKHNLKIINLKMFSPYGEDDNLKLIPILTQKLIKWEEISLINQSLCFTYIDDIVDAYSQSLDYFPVMKNNYEVFNIASPSTKISEIVNILEKISNKKLNITDNLYQETTEADVFCNTQKAEELLWWKSKTSLENWLKLTYNFYKNEI